MSSVPVVERASVATGVAINPAGSQLAIPILVFPTSTPIRAPGRNASAFQRRPDGLDGGGDG